MKKRKNWVILGLIILVLIVGVGGKKCMDNQKELSNEREAALALKKQDYNATKVVFTGKGGHSGVGLPWTIGASVTVKGKVYRMNLNKTGIDFALDGYDSTFPSFTGSDKIEVVYSNGKSEVLQ
ncbi:hypothetical protein [Lactococcus protaetiae]|uniref:Uncharacterized protein n=1 Tax=Lactococcus protaetiae TaxID=2592653 RepID=A0A514Z6D7_9LACT|nr:hypothetical protein [Lactococcus protaetiae]QDK70171.1 hypothetical protein FLP15_01980 [Lactococcus protaetiae]